MPVLTQSNEATLDYTHDWSSFLADGDSIASRAWSIAPNGPSLTGTTSATVTVSGMTAGNTYRLAEQITTANGVIAERVIVIRCVEALSG